MMKGSDTRRIFTRYSHLTDMKYSLAQTAADIWLVQVVKGTGWTNNINSVSVRRVSKKKKKKTSSKAIKNDQCLPLVNQWYHLIRGHHLQKQAWLSCWGSSTYHTPFQLNSWVHSHRAIKRLLHICIWREIQLKCIVISPGALCFLWIRC